PRYPADRIAYMLDDASPALVLTSKALLRGRRAVAPEIAIRPSGDLPFHAANMTVWAPCALVSSPPPSRHSPR
ncbi:hypothetical protein, partial [Kitasatospora sp. NPDC001095]